MTTMLLRADGVDVPYTVLSGHFDVTDGKLDICLELEIDDNDNDESPREIMIRFANINFRPGDNCLHICDHHDEWGADDGEPHAYVYTGFHHTEVSAWIEIESHDDSQLVASIQLVTDDVDHYDENASADSIVGTCELSRRSRNDLWCP